MRRRIMMMLALIVCAMLIPAFTDAGGSRATGSATGRAVADQPFSRFCKARDLVGTWQLVKYTTQYEFKNPNAPYLLPYQVFQFSADGTMKSAHSAQPFQGNPGKMLQAIPAVVTYGFEREGMVTVKAKGATTAAETWHCVSITQDRNDERHRAFMKRGDLVMTLVGKNGQPLFVRQLRKS